jgi:DNA-binding LytR/AlgR family response regulator
MPSKTILLVEDDYLNRRLTKKNLVEEGYYILEAKSVSDALTILKKEGADLAILDINLGEGQVDGIQLGKILQQQYNIPFIYLTAYDNGDIIGNALSTTPYSYLTKPFKKVDLIMAVEIALLQSANNTKYEPELKVKDGEYNVTIPYTDITYLESEGNYLSVYTNNHMYKYRSTIKQIMELLPTSIFIQTHRAFVVNKNKIEKFNAKHVIINNTLIPVAQKYIYYLLSNSSESTLTFNR